MQHFGINRKRPISSRNLTKFVRKLLLFCPFSDSEILYNLLSLPSYRLLFEFFNVDECNLNSSDSYLLFSYLDKRLLKSLLVYCSRNKSMYSLYLRGVDWHLHDRNNSPKWRSVSPRRSQKIFGMYECALLWWLSIWNLWWEWYFSEGYQTV